MSIKKETVIIGDIQSIKQHFNELLNPYCDIENMEKNKLYKINTPSDQIDEIISHDKNKDEGYSSIAIPGVYFYFEKHENDVELKSQKYLIEDKNPYVKKNVVERNLNRLKNFLTYVQ